MARTGNSWKPAWTGGGGAIGTFAELAAAEFLGFTDAEPVWFRTELVEGW